MEFDSAELFYDFSIDAFMSHPFSRVLRSKQPFTQLSADEIIEETCLMVVVNFFLTFFWNYAEKLQKAASCLQS